MLGRFEDPKIERDYVESERVARIPATRFLAGIGIVTLISYIGFNPMHFPMEGVLAYNMAAGPFVLLLVALVGLTFTKFYVEQAWVDIVVFTIMAVVMVALIDALGDQAPVTEINRFGMAVINLGILMVFASVGFVATTCYFLGWALVIVVLYVAFLLLADRTLVSKVYTFTNFSTFFTFSCFVNWDIDRRARKTYAAQLALEEERAKTENMLHNVLPSEVAERLKRGEAVADAFSDVSVIFIDIAGFSQLSKRLSPGHLIKVLNTIFGLADRCAERHGIERVKTIGDAYLAVAGAIGSSGRDAVDAIAFSKAMIEEVRAYSEKTGIDLAVRIGIHTGNVVGGVVGEQRLAYDYWGDTMNIANRIEGIAERNGIAVSESTYFEAFERESFSQPQLITLKGVGDVKVCRVVIEEDT